MYCEKQYKLYVMYFILYIEKFFIFHNENLSKIRRIFGARKTLFFVSSDFHIL